MQKSSTTLHLEKACVLQGIPQQPKLKKSSTKYLTTELKNHIPRLRTCLMLSNSPSFAFAHNSWWKSFSKMCILPYLRASAQMSSPPWGLGCQHTFFRLVFSASLSMLDAFQWHLLWKCAFLPHTYTKTHIHHTYTRYPPPKFLLISSFSMSDPNSYKVPWKFF